MGYFSFMTSNEQLSKIFYDFCFLKEKNVFLKTHKHKPRKANKLLFS